MPCMDNLPRLRMNFTSNMMSQTSPIRPKGGVVCPAKGRSRGAKTYVYHITSAANLRSIIDAGEIRPCSIMATMGTVYTNIAHIRIQGDRARTRVPYGPGGTLHDYVPLYFATRSPMLYAIHEGKVAGNAAGQAEVV